MYCVVEMQQFSKLYLTTKQMQVKCQLAYLVLADNAQTKEIEKRMTDMYRQEFKVLAGRAELCNFLLELLFASSEAKELNASCADLKAIYNVDNCLPVGSNKYLSVIDVVELNKEQASSESGLLLVLAGEDKLVSIARVLKGQLALVSEDMLRNNSISFKTCRNVRALVANEKFGGSLL